MDLHKLILALNFINVELTQIFDDCDSGVSPDCLMSRIDDLYVFGHKLEKALRVLQDEGGKIE